VTHTCFAGELHGLACSSRIDDLLRESGVAGTYLTWRAHRHFLSAAIRLPGSLLDIGCGNGWLLRCLQSWSGLTLVPYGIDVDATRIAAAHVLFPEYAANFVVGSVRDLSCLDAPNIPPRFQTIYWNIWDNWSLDIDAELHVAATLIRRLNGEGRLIFGFYDPDPRTNEKRAEALRAAGLATGPIVKNPTGAPELMTWFDNVVNP
jgi:SAM-dependent methyltransferase